MRLKLLSVVFMRMLCSIVSFTGRFSLPRKTVHNLRNFVTTADFPFVQIVQGKERIFEQGDPLVFDKAISKLNGKPGVGEEVLVKDYKGNLIARGLFNPLSSYRVRVIAFKDDKLIDEPLPVIIKERINQAVSLRSALLLPRSDTDVYRLVNSEGDRLSGMIVDVIGSTVVVQSSALWVEMQKDIIKEALLNQPQLQGKSILWRQALSRLNQDGLQLLDAETITEGAASIVSSSEAASAIDIEGASEVVIENGIKYKLCAATDQKTGFYCDQRENKQLIRSISQGKSVLDAYCYTGGFTLSAIKGGAASVTSIDSSANAMRSLAENAALNGFTAFNCSATDSDSNLSNADSDSNMSNADNRVGGEGDKDDRGQGKIGLLKGEAVRTMQELIAANKTYDIVICDPPKLAPKRTDLERAMHKYKQINKLAMQLVSKKGGLLLTCTCSAAMTQSGKFEYLVESAAKAAGRVITIISQTSAAPDHTTVVGCPESKYLTALLVYVH